MEYSLDHITTLADCDVLLGDADQEKFDLELARKQQEKQYRLATSSSGIETLLQTTRATITAYQNVAAPLEDGDTKTELLNKIKRLEIKESDLVKRRDRYGNLALLRKEYAITAIDKQLTENDTYIAALELRKTKI